MQRVQEYVGAKGRLNAVMRGIPLRRFGRYRVTNHSFRNPFFSLWDGDNDECVLSSYAKDALYFVAERLGVGQCACSPAEMERAAVEAMGDFYPTRFRFYVNHWLYDKDGMTTWRNGGPVPTWALWLHTSERERAAEKHRQDRAHAAEIGEYALESFDAEARKHMLRDARLWALYESCMWPDADTCAASSLNRALDDIEGSPLEVMLSVEYVAPEWIEAARSATVLMLRYGVDEDEVSVLRGVLPTPKREPLRVLARKLAARFGGAWTP